MQVQQMIAAHPDVQGNTNEALLRCIAECYSCAQACIAEEGVEKMRQCIRLDLDCADICAAAGAIASRRTGSNEQTIVAVLDACETACRLCAEECERHAGAHDHCRLCAEACRRCERACREAVVSIEAPV
ncbi:MAG: four-helix bundle copper-binding protein [Allosphingosinicella sp.]